MGKQRHIFFRVAQLGSLRLFLDIWIFSGAAQPTATRSLSVRYLRAKGTDVCFTSEAMLPLFESTFGVNEIIII